MSEPASYKQERLQQQIDWHSSTELNTEKRKVTPFIWYTISIWTTFYTYYLCHIKLIKQKITIDPNFSCTFYILCRFIQDFLNIKE